MGRARLVSTELFVRENFRHTGTKINNIASAISNTPLNSKSSGLPTLWCSISTTATSLRPMNCGRTCANNRSQALPNDQNPIPIDQTTNTHGNDAGSVPVRLRSFVIHYYLHLTSIVVKNTPTHQSSQHCPPSVSKIKKNAPPEPLIRCRQHHVETDADRLRYIPAARTAKSSRRLRKGSTAQWPSLDLLNNAAKTFVRMTCPGNCPGNLTLMFARRLTRLCGVYH